MSDNKIIGGKYIDNADKLRNTAVKYMIGLLLLVVFCWIFAETVFHKTKYESIRMNILEQKMADLRSRDNKQQHREYDSLKRKLGKQDSVTSEMYKAVEENIPQAFRFLLRKATQKPFGVLLTSLTTLALLLYLFSLRKRYLNSIGVGLRILKEDGGYNTIRDYNFNIPFWASPIYKDSINGVSRNEVIIIGGLRGKTRLHIVMICLLLLSLVFIQIRLYYISCITNSYYLDWVLLLQTVVLLFTLAIVVVWLMPDRLPDAYRSENASNSASKRNFITMSVFAVSGLILGSFSRVASNMITKRMLKPRYVIRKNTHKNTISVDCRRIELMALDAIKSKDLVKASDILFTRISAPVGAVSRHYIRLFDLLIYLCYRKKEIYTAKYLKIFVIAKKSNDKKLLEKCEAWKKKDAKRKKYGIAKSNWDRIEISKYVKVD